MEWLENWDDLVHGTAVFSAAAPSVLVLALCWKLPVRFWWAAVALAVVPVSYWLFQFPSIPATGSDDVAMTVLLAAAAMIALGGYLSKSLLWPLRLIAFVAIGWSLYPAWLAEGGGVGRRWLVCGGFGGSITLLSLLVEWLAGRGGERRFYLTPAALIPPSMALAVLLQTGGSMRFAQVSGALAAGLAALCLAMLIWGGRENLGKQGGAAALWGMLFVALALSGWLFAEIRYGLACLLLCAPLVAVAVRLIPRLPRTNLFLCLLWDLVAAALVSVPVAAIAALQYAAEMAGFEGY